MHRKPATLLFAFVTLIVWTSSCVPTPGISGPNVEGVGQTPGLMPSRLLQRASRSTTTPGASLADQAETPAAILPTSTLGATAEPAEEWVGMVIAKDVPAPFDDYFQRADGTRFGIEARDPATEAQIEQLRDTGRTLRVWGDVTLEADDYNGMRLNVGRLEIEAPATEKVTSLRGTVLSSATSASAEPLFETTDGTRYVLSAHDEALQRLAGESDKDTTVRVWGWLVLAGAPLAAGTATPVDGANKASAPVGTLVIDRIEIEGAASTPVEGWMGLVIGNPPGAQFDDYFQMLDQVAARHGVASADPALAQEIIDLRDTGQTVWLWGMLMREADDAYDSLIEVTRIETEAPRPRADGWTGSIVRRLAEDQYVDQFQADNGRLYVLSVEDEATRALVLDATWRGAAVQVWGTVTKGESNGSEGGIIVERIEVAEQAAGDLRNLSPFAQTEATSTLPPDGGGSYGSDLAIDGSAATCWAEGAGGPGIGEAITLTFPSAVEVSHLILTGGFARDQALFAANNRPRQITLYFAGGHQALVSLPNTMGPQTVNISPVRTEYVAMTIESAHPGARYDDTCLSELEVWGRVLPQTGPS